MLKTVPGAAPGNPDIFECRMAVNQEIAIGGVFVLADTDFYHRSIPQARKVLIHIMAPLHDGLLIHNPHGGVRIQVSTMAIKSNFHAPVINVRKHVWALRMAVVQPCRHVTNAKTVITGRYTEEENLLPRGMDALCKQFGKQFRQPRSAGKNECSGRDGST